MFRKRDNRSLPWYVELVLELVLVLLCGCLLVALLPAEIPDVPPDANFINDYVGLISAEDANQIGQVQQKAFEQNDTPIIVVTIASMAQYGFDGRHIESFAGQWFNKWEIGTLSREGGSNKGILLLVSTGDRKARIELGADWGRSWDGHCQKIMDSTIIPHFKQGDFSGGIRDGVLQLGEMAAIGPEAEAPASSPVDRLTSDKPLTPLTPLPPIGSLVLFLIGVVCWVAAIFVPAHRQKLILAGIGFILAGVFLWLVLVVLGMIFRGRSRHGGSSFGGGGFSSGGGFGGGFSGGGGASGGW